MGTELLAARRMDRQNVGRVAISASERTAGIAVDGVGNGNDGGKDEEKSREREGPKDKFEEAAPTTALAEDGEGSTMVADVLRWWKRRRSCPRGFVFEDRDDYDDSSNENHSDRGTPRNHREEIRNVSRISTNSRERIGSERDAGQDKSSGDDR